jgi:hypothetical protein
MTSIAARLDQVPAAAWVALAVLGFVIWWPLGLAILAYILWSGRMWCCGNGFGRWHEGAGHASQASNGWRPPHASGNRAFDEYRADTLRRLEEEQRGFQEFLGRLRMAKDKAEFDQFMAERGVPAEPSAPPPAA